MELLDFYKSLKSHRRTLILVPLVTVIVAFIVVRLLPKKYVSHTRLTTGIADPSTQLAGDNYRDNNLDREFDNIAQSLILNKVLDRVSYKLILHDLATNKPFRDSKYITDDKRVKIATDFAKRYAQEIPFSGLDTGELNTSEILVSLGYDNKSLKKSLKVTRVENSDFISMEFESENPLLSAFVLNTLSSEFIEYYTTVISANKTRQVIFLDSLLANKRNALATQMELLTDFKIRSNILNQDGQSQSMYAQISDISTKRSMAEKEALAYSAALRGINSHLNNENKDHFDGKASNLNHDIVRIKDRLDVLSDMYVKSGFNSRYKTQMDSLQSGLTEKIQMQADKYPYSPVTTKQNLVGQKIEMEVSRDIANSSAQSLDRTLGILTSGLQNMVPDATHLQTFEANVAIANREYTEILRKYNDASMNAAYILPVRQVEMAVPENANPDRKILLVGFSGIMSLICCLLAFFCVFYFDRSIYTTTQLETDTGFRVLGSLNLLRDRNPDLKSLWQQNGMDMHVYKNLLRSIRFEIENCLEDQKVLAITSFQTGVGKTTLTTGLAYAFSKINKKVLVIDGNFLHPEISNGIPKPVYLENFLLESNVSKKNQTSIRVLGNKGGDSSLLELGSRTAIAEVFRQLKDIYDVILIETGSLDDINKSKAKEWNIFADKVAIVIEAGQSVDAFMETERSYLQSLNGKFCGFVLNKVPSTGIADSNATETITKPTILQLAVRGVANLRSGKFSIMSLSESK